MNFLSALGSLFYSLFLYCRNVIQLVNPKIQCDQKERILCPVCLVLLLYSRSCIFLCSSSCLRILAKMGCELCDLNSFSNVCRLSGAIGAAESWLFTDDTEWDLARIQASITCCSSWSRFATSFTSSFFAIVTTISSWLQNGQGLGGFWLLGGSCTWR